MKIEFEERHDILNIQFLDDCEIAKSNEFDGIIFDYAKDGRIVSVEILDISKRIMPKPIETINFSIIRDTAK